MHRPASVRRLSVLVLVLAISAILFSTRRAMTDSTVPVNSFAGLASNDSVPWSQLGPNATGLSTTFNANSTHAVAVSGTLAGVGSLVTVVCPASVCSWVSTDVNGFLSGDSVIWTSDTANGGNGPLTLSLSKSVAGVGAFIQADAPGQFTAQIQAFNGNTSLGTFVEQSDAAGDAVFLGALDNTAAHITSVVFGLSACTPAVASTSCNLTDFAIDTLFINSAGGPTPTPTAPVATPTGTVAPPTPTPTPLAPTPTATVAQPTPTPTVNPPTTTATPQPTMTATAIPPTTTATPSQPTTTPTATPGGGPETSMVATPPQIKFSNVNATGAGKARKVIILNKGAVNAVVESVNAPSIFPIVPTSDLCTNRIVPPNGRCTVMVQFSPTAPGPTSAKLTAVYNGVAPAQVELSGIGTAVSVRAPASVLLPLTAAGSTSAPKLVTITNLSTTASVQMGTAILSGPPFTIASDTCSGAPIAPRGKCTIGVEFTAPPGTSHGSRMAGTLDLGFTYGSNSGAAPTVSLIGKVR